VLVLVLGGRHFAYFAEAAPWAARQQERSWRHVLAKREGVWAAWLAWLLSLVFQGDTAHGSPAPWHPH
jgi:hypothetical protein